MSSDEQIEEVPNNRDMFEARVLTMLDHLEDGMQSINHRVSALEDKTPQSGLEAETNHWRLVVLLDAKEKALVRNFSVFSHNLKSLTPLESSSSSSSPQVIVAE